MYLRIWLPVGPNIDILNVGGLSENEDNVLNAEDIFPDTAHSLVPNWE